jgi:hypothetical protein
LWVCVWGSISSIFLFLIHPLNCQQPFLLIIHDYNYTGMVRTILFLKDGTE